MTLTYTLRTDLRNRLEEELAEDGLKIESEELENYMTEAIIRVKEERHLLYSIILNHSVRIAKEMINYDRRRISPASK
jgi:hypothetical protein